MNIGYVFQPNTEFVPAEPRDLATAHCARLVFVCEPTGDLHQHCVADGMPERIVDFLEAIQIHRQQRARYTDCSIPDSQIDFFFECGAIK